jgi:Mg2+ and Co2+ transporter CorA
MSETGCLPVRVPRASSSSEPTTPILLAHQSNEAIRSSPGSPTGPPAKGLTEGLRSLNGKTCKEQAEFWRGVALSLRVTVPVLDKKGKVVPGSELQCQWYSNTAAKCEDSHYDALGRYFDATPVGLEYIYKKKAHPELGMCLSGFKNALVDHFGFPAETVMETRPEKASSQGLAELFDVASVDDRMNQESFAEVMRKLRIAAILECGASKQFASINTEVYLSEHDDDDWDLRVIEPDLEDLEDVAPRILSSPKAISRVKSHYMISPIKEFFFVNPHHPTGEFARSERMSTLQVSRLESQHRRISRKETNEPKTNEPETKVHWLHIHHPTKLLVLALGQQFHLRLSVMGMLCRINDIPPQIDLATDKSRGGRTASRGGTSNWSAIVLPSYTLDRQSRMSLDTYRAWKAWREESAQEAAYAAKSRNKSSTSRRRADARTSRGKEMPPGMSETEPNIFVGVVQVTQILLWADTSGGVGKREAIVTSLGTPKYLGRWAAHALSRDEAEQGMITKLLESCCGKRRRPDHQEASNAKANARRPEGTESETTPLLQHRAGLCAPTHVGGQSYTLGEDVSEEEDEDDLEATARSETASLFEYEAVEQQMQDNSGGTAALLRYQQEAEENTAFRKFYSDVIEQLTEKYSVLRMGTHFHLLIRIILDGSTEYSDVVDLYEIVISQCQAALEVPGLRDGPNLMTMISCSKRELTAVLRQVTTLKQEVLPGLENACRQAHEPVEPDHHGVRKQSSDHPSPKESNVLSERMIRHHMIDIHHNIDQVIQECQGLIHICETLVEDYDRKTGDKGNTILNILTFVTFAIVPLQLLTGYYGMNFNHGMSEMKWKEGMIIFWAMALGGTVLTLVAMAILRRFL